MVEGLGGASSYKEPLKRVLMGNWGSGEES